MEILNNEKSKLVGVFFSLMIILCVYFGVKTISEIKNYDNLPSGATAVNTISFDGKGEVSATPDLATISFTITGDAKDVIGAQTKVTTKETAVLDFLNKNDIAKSDIKTENYNSSPQYQYLNSACPQPMQNQSYPGSAPNMPTYCPPGKQVLTGYEVSENISVKIHDITKTGQLIKGVGDIGISNISGPNFSIEKEDALKEQARKIAIDDAKSKAAALSHDLGVRLVRIVSFSENGNYPVPMYATKDMMSGGVASTATPAPALPTGENKITSNVTITYEIR